MNPVPTSPPKPKQTREASLALLYLLVLIVGSTAAMTEILPHRTAIGEFSNSGRVGVFWSGLLCVLSLVVFVRTSWKLWWAKALLLLILLVWCGFLTSEITGYAYSSTIRQLK